MESIVEDVEDERQTEGNPANYQKCNNFDGWDDMEHPSGVHHADGVFTIHYQDGHNVFSDAIKLENYKYSNYKSILSTRFEG